MREPKKLPAGAIVLAPGGGRAYELGAMRAVFKADGTETDDRYCVSEWWLDPRTKGPGAHQHDENDELFYTLQGSPSLLIGVEWFEAPAGSFILVPRRTMHDFANETDQRCGLLNVFIPGGFEPLMPAIVSWFAENR